MKKLFLILLATLFAASGCAGLRSSEAGYAARLEPLRGVHIDDLVMSWGPPDAEHTFEDGRKMYAFVESKAVTIQHFGPTSVRLQRHYGRSFYRDATMLGLEVREYRCETRFITDKDGRIMEWTFQGNACRATPPEPAARAEHRRNN